LIGAGVSAYGRHKRNGLFAGVQESSSPSALDGMSWQEFEMLVGEAFGAGDTRFPKLAVAARWWR